MSVALTKPMTVEAFLTWERQQERPFEFDGHEVLAMNGGTYAHSAIGLNLAVALRSRLSATSFLTLYGSIKVATGSGTIRYPDLLVTRGPFPRKDDIAPDPVVVVEILSPSTQREDRYRKNAEYRATASIQHYVMVEQDAIAAEVFSRRGEEWIGEALSDDASIRLPALGIEVPLAEIFAGIEPDSESGSGTP